ncbi:MAG: SPASM domain-containing protein, partial [Planctomycetota bacterium]
GDINEDSLANIWRGESLQNLRIAHVEGQYGSIPLCSKCQFWKCEVNIEKWLSRVNPSYKERFVYSKNASKATI